MSLTFSHNNHIYKAMKYHCEMQTLGQFLQRFAVYILNYGHYFYVADVIPPGRTLSHTDRKICEQYGITHCRQTRKNRRDRGEASVHYVRFKNAFVIIASEGKSDFFIQEQWTDIRQEPLYISGYSLGIRDEKSCVRIQGKRWIPLEKKFIGMTYFEIRNLQRYYDLITPFRYSGIIEQMERLRTKINHKRKRASLPLLQSWDWWRGKTAQEAFEKKQRHSTESMFDDSHLS